MINLDDIARARTSSAPTPGPWVVTDSGKVVPHNCENPALEYIADIQLAPQGARNIPIICASSLMFEALRKVKSDPKFKRLSEETKDHVQYALGASE